MLFNNKEDARDLYLVHKNKLHSLPVLPCSPKKDPVLRDFKIEWNFPITVLCDLSQRSFTTIINALKKITISNAATFLPHSFFRKITKPQWRALSLFPSRWTPVSCCGWMEREATTHHLPAVTLCLTSSPDPYLDNTFRCKLQRAAPSGQDRQSCCCVVILLLHGWSFSFITLLKKATRCLFWTSPLHKPLPDKSRKGHRDEI